MEPNGPEGRNFTGVLGNGNNTDSPVPVTALVPTGIVAISGGHEYCTALRDQLHRCAAGQHVRSGRVRSRGRTALIRPGIHELATVDVSAWPAGLHYMRIAPHQGRSCTTAW